MEKIIVCCYYKTWVSHKAYDRKRAREKADKILKSVVTKLVIWDVKKSTSFTLKVVNAFESQRDFTETSEVSCLASHKERSTNLSQIKEPWISYSQQRNNEFQISTFNLLFEHTKPLSKELLEGPRFEYQVLIEKVPCVLSGAQVRGNFKSGALLRRDLQT